MASDPVPDSFLPPSNADNKVRIEDYLNDKLQTNSDLDNIDSLLEDVRKQQNLLRKQVSFRAWPMNNIDIAVARRGRRGSS